MLGTTGPGALADPEGFPFSRQRLQAGKNDRRHNNCNATAIATTNNPGHLK
jgi:hypothetical protein